MVLLIGRIPLYSHASYKQVIPRFVSTTPPSLKVCRFHFPDDFDEMDIDKQRQSRAIFRLEETNLYYTAATGVHSEERMDVLKLPYLGIQ